MINDWTTASLWLAIKNRTGAGAHSWQAFLMTWMPRIQDVLASAGTSPTDFTLHDTGHAFRVAQRMVSIIPATTLSGLSTSELALLLLSAYLHDVGMTPELRRVRLHYSYLLTGDPATSQGASLANIEREEFQRWLDNDGRGLVPPIARQPLSAAGVATANEIIRHYCRH